MQLLDIEHSVPTLITQFQLYIIPALCNIDCAIITLINHDCAIIILCNHLDTEQVILQSQQNRRGINGDTIYTFHTIKKCRMNNTVQTVNRSPNSIFFKTLNTVQTRQCLRYRYLHNVLYMTRYTVHILNYSNHWIRQSSLKALNTAVLAQNYWNYWTQPTRYTIYGTQYVYIQNYSSYWTHTPHRELLN